MLSIVSSVFWGLLLFIFSAVPYLTVFAIVFIALTFSPSARLRESVIASAFVSVCVNLSIVLIFDHSPIEHASLFVSLLIGNLLIAVIAGFVAAVPNLHTIVEGDDETSRRPRLIVFCAMLGGFMLSAMFNNSSPIRSYMEKNELTLAQLLAKAALEIISVLPILAALIVATGLIYFILRKIRKRHDFIGIITPLASAMLLTSVTLAVWSANPIIEIPREYRDYIEADELSALKTRLPGELPRFKHRVEVISADDERVVAWFCYFNRSYRTKCILERRESGELEVIYDAEPCMNPFGW